MYRFSFIMSICLCISSFGQSPKKSVLKSFDQIREEFVDVLLDSTATWKQFTEVTYPFIDSLCAKITDVSSLGNRLFGQEWGHNMISLIGEKYAQSKEAGKDVNYDDVSNIFDKLVPAMAKWFYSPDEEGPYIWRDLMYYCHQDSDEPTFGFITMEVDIPTDVVLEPSLCIYYPDAAESSPIMVFSKYKGNGSIEEDRESQEVVRLENWAPKDSIEEGYPMCAIADASVVEKMLHYDVVYLEFLSDTSANGDPGELEIARLSLNFFQQQWNKVVRCH